MVALHDEKSAEETMSMATDLDRELDEMAEQELNRGASTSAAAASSLPVPVASRDDKNLAVATHVGTIAAAVFSGGLLHVIVPAVAHFALGDKSEFLREHTKNQLNFQVTYLAVLAAAVVLSVITFGVGAIVAVPAVLFFFVLDMVTSIRAALAASRGEEYKFPMSLHLVS